MPEPNERKDTEGIKWQFSVALGGVVGRRALGYKPAGRGFDSRLCHWNFSVT